MDQVLDFFEQKAVPDKERIINGWSDLVWQPESNADIIYRESGERPMQSRCQIIHGFSCAWHTRQH